MIQFYASGGQCIRVSASTSVLPMNIQDWLLLELIGWISLQSKGLSRIFSSTTAQKHQFLALSFPYSQFPHPYMTTGKIIALTRWAFVGKVMSLLFNLEKLCCHSFSSKEQGSFNFMAAVNICSDFGAPVPPKKKQLSLLQLFPHLFAMKSWDQMPWS